MKKYLTFCKSIVQISIIYRGPMLIWVIGGMITMLVISAMWQTASGAQTLGGYTRSELVSYYLIGFIFSWMTGWYPFNNVSEEIKDGSIAWKVLIKQVSYLWLNICTEATWHAVSLIFVLTVVILSVVIFGINLVVSLVFPQLVFLLMALALAALVSFSFCMCLGVLALWFTEVSTLFRIIFWGGMGLFGGQALPISFIPGVFHNLIKILPYRYIYSFPLEIYFSKISPGEIYAGIFVASAWAGFFLILFNFLWSRGLKGYAAYGH